MSDPVQEILHSSSSTSRLKEALEEVGIDSLTVAETLQDIINDNSAKNAGTRLRALELAASILEPSGSNVAEQEIRITVTDKEKLRGMANPYDEVLPQKKSLGGLTQ